MLSHFCLDGPQIMFASPDTVTHFVPWSETEALGDLRECCWWRLLLLRSRSIPAKMLLLSRFSRVRLWATPQTAAHQAPPSRGFSRREHWSGLPFPSPVHESEKWKGSCSVVSDSSRPHGLQPARLLHPGDFPGKSTGVGATVCKMGFSDDASGKEPACPCRRLKRRGFDPWVGKMPQRKAWQPT